MLHAVPPLVGNDTKTQSQIALTAGSSPFAPHNIVLLMYRNTKNRNMQNHCLSLKKEKQYK